MATQLNFNRQMRLTYHLTPNDMSHCGTLKNNDVLPLDIESTEVKGYHVSCIQNTFCHYMSVKKEFSCYPSFQPSVLF